MPDSTSCCAVLQVPSHAVSRLPELLDDEEDEEDEDDEDEDVDDVDDEDVDEAADELELWVGTAPQPKPHIITATRPTATKRWIAMEPFLFYWSYW